MTMYFFVVTAKSYGALPGVFGEFGLHEMLLNMFEVLCNVYAMWMPNGVWKHEVYLDCVNRFNEDTTNKKTVEQLKNRTRSWKKTYQAVISYLNTTGFGWDATTHRVTACHSVWQDYIKYRQQGCPLYDKLVLVVGNSIAMGRTSQIDEDMCNDVQYQEENEHVDKLEDVDLGRDTPSSFFTENESTPDQSPSTNPSTSSHRRKRPQIATDDSIMFADTMTKIATLLQSLQPKNDKTTRENWYEALTEILDPSVEMKFCAPLLLDTPMKKDMFTKLPVEERLNWLKYCADLGFHDCRVLIARMNIVSMEDKNRNTRMILWTCLIYMMGRYYMNHRYRRTLRPRGIGDILYSKEFLSPTKTISMEEQLAYFLLTVGQGQAYSIRDHNTVCTFDMQFTYVLVGWEGLTTDFHVLKDALTRKNRICVPEGKYYLVDADYANMS
ncbi:uncharacterized protein [Aristolochia californica]|uniref:uncharacterized protein n=1 Tax=Aristolochia californica TaxID=171875 RepID=UPI0035D78FFE